MAEKLSKHYSVREADLEADRHHILRMWTMISSSAKPDSQKLDLFYIQNPAGPGVMYMLWHEPSDSAVGITCAGRRDILVGGSIVKGAVCGDLIIDPAHRSLGSSLLLQRFVMKRSLEQFDLFYAFPNERGAKAIMRGVTALESALIKMVLPLRASRYLLRYMPKALASILSAPAQFAMDLVLRVRVPRARSGYREEAVDDAFLDTLWDTVASGESSIGVRDATFLRWRLNQDPAAGASFFGTADADGAPAGYIAYALKDYSTVKILDVLALDESVFETMIVLFIRSMSKRRIESISIRQCIDLPTRCEFLKSLG
ncbi:MAG: hypothetical protein ACREQ1_14185, partial [Woeseiaceae bacterium]